MVIFGTMTTWISISSMSTVVGVVGCFIVTRHLSPRTSMSSVTTSCSVSMISRVIVVIISYSCA